MWQIVTTTLNPAEGDYLVGCQFDEGLTLPVMGTTPERARGLAADPFTFRHPAPCIYDF